MSENKSSEKMNPEKQKRPIPPRILLEKSKLLTPKQIDRLHALGMKYVEELFSLLEGEENRKLLMKYLGLSDEEASELEKEAIALLPPDEVESLKERPPQYPLGAEGYRWIRAEGTPP